MIEYVIIGEVGASSSYGASSSSEISQLSLACRPEWESSYES